MLYLEKSYPYLVAKALFSHTLNFKNAHVSMPLAAIITILTSIVLSEHLHEWWYTPAWMVIMMTAVYIADLYFAVVLTGRLKDMSWEFRSDKFTVWVSNYIGALLMIGLLHILPIASREILASQGVGEASVDSVYSTLVIVAWGAYIGICVSNILSALSNAVRGGVIKKYVAGWVMKQLDSYKPSIYDKK